MENNEVGRNQKGENSPIGLSELGNRSSTSNSHQADKDSEQPTGAPPEGVQLEPERGTTEVVRGEVIEGTPEGALEGVPEGALEEREEGEEEEELPPWLLDEPPVGVMDRVKWRLMHGESEQDITDSGENPTTVRMAAYYLEKGGFRKRPPKSSKGKVGKDLTVVSGYPAPIKTWTRGSPPEALINSISIPVDTTEGKIFESGVKAGASLVVLGVRVAQELSNIGIQQAKPVMDMARAMREGEALAAKTASMEAAEDAAARVANIFGPVLERATRPVERVESPASGNPVKDMIVRTMEPLFKQLMGMVMPGVKTDQSGGWTVEKE